MVRKGRPIARRGGHTMTTAGAVTLNAAGVGATSPVRKAWPVIPARVGRHVRLITWYRPRAVRAAHAVAAAMVRVAAVV